MRKLIKKKTNRPEIRGKNNEKKNLANIPEKNNK